MAVRSGVPVAGVWGADEVVGVGAVVLVVVADGGSVVGVLASRGAEVVVSAAVVVDGGAAVVVVPDPPHPATTRATARAISVAVRTGGVRFLLLSLPGLLLLRAPTDMPPRSQPGSGGPVRATIQPARRRRQG